MDDNSAILELITEFLVSKNLLHTAQTLQHEWAANYPGLSFPYITNLLGETTSTTIPVEPAAHSAPYFFQPGHAVNMRGGEMDEREGDEEDEEGGEGMDGVTSDEPMNEHEDEGDDDIEEGEIDEEGGVGAETAEEGEGDADDAASVDSAYDRVLVEDISEIMNEIAVDEEDMGEIDPLANEVSPSDESESEMDEGDIGDDDEYDDEEEGEEEEGDEEEEEEEGDEGEDAEEDEEGEDEQEEEEEEEPENEGIEHGEREKSGTSPTRGVIESVSELLGQHIQNQRDEFYQEEEGKTEADKDLAAIELAKLQIGEEHVPSIVLDPPMEGENKGDEARGDDTTKRSAPSLAPLETDPELRSFNCDVPIMNYENKKSGGMFSPLISPTPHSPTPVLSPGVVPSFRATGGDGATTPTASSASAPSGSPLMHSRSALYKREVASPLGKKHVQITSDSAPTSRSNSNLSARHNSPPPSSPTLNRIRPSTSTPTLSASQKSPSGSPHLKSSPSHSPSSSSPSNASPSLPINPTTPSTPPPPYTLDPSDTTLTTPTSPNPTPNGIISQQPETRSKTESSATGQEGTGTGTKADRRQSLDQGKDVVMRDILSPRSIAAAEVPFVYPVQVDGTTYDCFNLKIVHVKNRTGFESTKDFPIKPNTLVAGRYQIMEFLDSAAFSKAIRALDLHTGSEVCMKIIKNNKDYVDQSLDEIKLLKYLNSMGDPHKHNILQLYDFFYYKEHLFIVTELLRENLYEFYKFINENGHPPYFTIPRLQRVAQQCLLALQFIHGLDIIHTDLKPENILIKSYSRCEIKIIDFGSSCFTRDHLGSYVQSRDYRAVEVILGLPYSAKIDIWSLGCILAELFSGKVLFVNRSLATLLARVSALVGPIHPDMIAKGRFSHKFFTKYNSMLYERDEKTGQYFFLQPKRIQLKDWMKCDDEDFVDFVETLLALRPDDRPTATAALQHKWLRKEYPPIQ